MTVRELIPLPNKDLWRGYERKPRTKNQAKAEVFAEAAPAPTAPIEDLAPIDRIMGAIVKTAAGGTPSCLWCGQQYVEVEMRDHIKTFHKAVLTPLTDVQVLAQAVADGQLALVAATVAPITE